jgi:hypothetical protein
MARFLVCAHAAMGDPDRRLASSGAVPSSRGDGLDDETRQSELVGDLPRCSVARVRVHAETRDEHEHEREEPKEEAVGEGACQLSACNGTIESSDVSHHRDRTPVAESPFELEKYPYCPCSKLPDPREDARTPGSGLLVGTLALVHASAQNDQNTGTTSTATAPKSPSSGRPSFQ